MNEMNVVELNKRQRELLLQGLRFVRSSLMLDIHDLPTVEIETERETRLREIASLVDHLSGSSASRKTTEVS